MKLNLKGNKLLYVLAIIINAVGFGLANMVDVLSNTPRNVENYPVIELFIWTLLVAWVGYKGWKQSFYCNAVPLLILMVTTIFYHRPDQPAMNVEFFIVIIGLILVTAGFVVGLIWQLIEAFKVSQFKKRLLTKAAERKRNEAADEDEEDELETVEVDLETYNGLAAALLNEELEIDESMILEHWEYHSYCDHGDIQEAIQAAKKFYERGQVDDPVKVLMLRLPMILKPSGARKEFCRIVFHGIEDPASIEVMGIVERETKTLDAVPRKEIIEYLKVHFGATSYTIERGLEAPQEKMPFYTVRSMQASET
ncbi:hypothetical protein ABES02_29130 [Neobacillus pocheonensis]|uniref:hypothetical protein n=1 Tax=Neobacillus pocheonensis TaxID=363869 RepID=UPI003D299FB7